jgi:hypothetical protein
LKEKKMLSKKNNIIYNGRLFGGSLFDEKDEVFGNQTIVEMGRELIEWAREVLPKNP